jgi:hypothetical protein
MAPSHNVKAFDIDISLCPMRRSEEERRRG